MMLWQDVYYYQPPLQSKKAFSIIALLFLSLWGHAQKNDTIVFESSDKLPFIGKQMKVFRDHSKALTIQDILSSPYQAQFQNNHSKLFIFKAADDAVWFKFTIQNKSKKDIWLKTSGIDVWYLDFYTPNARGEYKTPTFLTGALRPEADTLFPANFYCLPLAKANNQQVQTYYLRIRTKFPKTYAFRVGTGLMLTNFFKAYDYLIAGFLGVMLSMLVYNLFLLITTKDTIYIYYLGYLTVFSVVVPFIESYPLFRHNWLWEYFFAWHNLVYLFASLFAIHYLKLRQNAPWLYYWIVSLTFFISFILPLLNIFQIVTLVKLYHIFEPILFLYYLSLFISGVYVWQKGYRQARFYVFGWFFLIMGVFIFMFMVKGLLPLNMFTSHSVSIGICLEAVMFSLALGDRLSFLKKGKELAQAQNLLLIQEQNTLLEQHVEKRTEEIRAMNEELHQNNEELTHFNEKLDIQSKELQRSNAIKNQLFAIIGHDLRSPIHSLKGLLELVSKQHMSLEEFQEFSGRLKDSVEHVHFTLNNLLQWANAQLQGIKTIPQSFNVFHIANENIHLLEEFSKNKSLQVQNHIDQQLSAFADIDQVNLVFRNLLSNAMKFTEYEGLIILKSDTNDTNDLCKVSITDTGLGMSEKMVADLFLSDTIQSKKGTGGEKGTGLGLILCKEFVENNGGEIWAESNLGEGTTFYFTIPFRKLL